MPDSKQAGGKPTENALSTLLISAFKLLESKFSQLDRDNAGLLMFKELENELARVGFSDEKKLEALFKSVDFDKSGTLDFKEFLSLLYLWHNVENGDYSKLFSAADAEIVCGSFACIDEQMQKYDSDKSRRLSSAELEVFFREQWPEATMRSGSGVFERVESLFVKVGRELSFPGFMLLLYTVAARMPGSPLDGRYAPHATEPRADVVGPESVFWQDLVSAFTEIEKDFRRFDKDGSGLVTFTEITSGIPPTRPGCERLSIISKLQYAFKNVDWDRSDSLDFFEYMYLGFWMTCAGSYLDLVSDSEGCRIVKLMFINLHAFYVKYDTDGNKRLTYDELETFCMDRFGQVPAGLERIFDLVKYESRATGGRSAVDVPNFMKLLYMLVRPDGSFHPCRYDPSRPAAPPPAALPAAEGGGEAGVPSAEAAAAAAARSAAAKVKPPRFETVEPGEFVKGRLLGKGTQGIVYAGSYRGVPCAGKFLLGEVNENILRAARAEMDFCLRLEHPHCLYLLGARVSADEGGTLFLTEICAQGSLFDLYAVRRKPVARATALRLGAECARGLREIQGMGFMHRDIKSLNVFLTAEMTAKIADFGYCTRQVASSDLCGTHQWMAPEIIPNMFKKKSKYGRQVDVYSFGILLWELMHCRVPYAETGLNQMQVARSVLESGLRPPISGSCIPAVRELMVACWATQPTSRPSFDEIAERLEALAGAV